MDFHLFVYRIAVPDEKMELEEEQIPADQVPIKVEKVEKVEPRSLGGLSQVFGEESDRKACSHEMCVPPNYTEPETAIDLEGPKEPVRKYKFILDPFQKVLLRVNFFLNDSSRFPLPVLNKATLS